MDLWDRLEVSKKPAKRDEIKLFRLRPGNTVQALLLAKVVGVNLHWHNQSSMPCLGTGCVLCPDPDRYYRSYSPAMIWDRPETRGIRVVLELNEECTLTIF